MVTSVTAINRKVLHTHCISRYLVCVSSHCYNIFPDMMIYRTDPSACLQYHI